MGTKSPLIAGSKRKEEATEASTKKAHSAPKVDTQPLPIGTYLFAP
jgi:hypothetical protein